MNNTDNVIPIKDRAHARLLAEAQRLVSGFIRMQHDAGVEPSVTCWPLDESDTKLRGWVSSSGYIIFENEQVKRLGRPVTDLTDTELPLEYLVERLRKEVGAAYC